MVSWLHGLSPRIISHSSEDFPEVQRLGGEMKILELTPVDCPFPVVAVIGGIPRDGQMRYSLGVACKTTYERALEKAYMEWAQGVFFAGVFQDFTDPKSFESPNDLKNFDDHAIYYSINPHEWPDLPFLHGEQYSMPAETGKERTVEESLRTLRQYLQKHLSLIHI